MSFKNCFVILAACVAGFLGGLLSSNSHVDAAPQDVIRASKFELVNSEGIAVANWEVDSGQEVHLRFLYKHDSVGAEFGILADGRPFLRMRGRDRKRRIVMELDQADKPMLGMGDERWEGRVRLGFIPPDTFPYSDWDHWGLFFRPFGSARPIAGIGMMQTGSSPLEGFLSVSGKRIR